MNSKFAKVPERPNFPEEEKKVLEYWNEIDAFHKQLELTKDLPQYSFFDGPPFATGLPHYGHIAAGTIKDVMCRYATAKGHYVERRFGWDCHGLPIEYEIDKRDKITSSVEREEIGVQEYNRRCREIVMTYSSEWEKIIGRFGRWIDFKNDYKTMDCSFMESVWWSFKQIYNRGLVYRGSKIMPYSNACQTVLSNFEAGSNYKDTKDPAIIIKFPLLDDPETKLIAWTTTPWTLPSNLACAVNPEFTYLKIQDEDSKEIYILLDARLKDICKQANIKKHKVLEKIKGKDLVGKKYKPLFNFFEHMREQNCFSVIGGSFVTQTAGTGIVHCAPGFGEEDYQACVKSGLIEPGKAVCPVDSDGKFTKAVTTYHGQYIKDADKVITKDLKEAGRLVASGTITHSYPFCWRSQQPLIYRAFNCWFIKVTDIKDEIQEKNKDPKWVPSFVQEKRFQNWLADAKDWCISRNRYWGNPIPIWISEDGEEVVCVGSIKELEELSGVTGISDLHRESIDHITIPSKEGRGVLKRIPEVFDCWFESGSMPYAQSHYPFSISEEKFNERFPADFIAEGLDQTRGWFYTLMVISTAIKHQAPFKNLIVNGIVLAEDGTKMSKSKKNYPPPMKIAENYGADACRLYLCNSPVVRAEPLKFQETGVNGIVRDIFLPWFNAYRFLIQNIARLQMQTNKNFIFDKTIKQNLAGGNLMDQWIISANHSLIKSVRFEMDNYKLYNVVKPLLNFLEQLTNWYVRCNRSRMKGEEGEADQVKSLNILFEVLMNTTIMMSSITPFLSEHIYQNLKNGIAEDDKSLLQDSIHFLRVPECDESLINEQIETRVKRMQSVIETGRLIRDRKNISLKTPFKTVKLVDSDQNALNDFLEVKNYIQDELNCLGIEVTQDEDEFIVYTCEADNKLMGQALKKQFDKKFKQKLAELTSAQLREYLLTGNLEVNGIKIEEGWLKVVKNFNSKYVDDQKYGCACSSMSSVIIDTTMDEELLNMGQSREITNRIQKLRKSTGISIDDQIEIYYTLKNASGTMSKVVSEHKDKIRSTVKMPFVPLSEVDSKGVFVGQTEYVNPNDPEDVIEVHIYKQKVLVNQDSLKQKGHSDSDIAMIDAYLNSLNKAMLQKELKESAGAKEFSLDGKPVKVEHMKDFFFGRAERK